MQYNTRTKNLHPEELAKYTAEGAAPHSDRSCEFWEVPSN